MPHCSMKVDLTRKPVNAGQSKRVRPVWHGKIWSGTKKQISVEYKTSEVKAAQSQREFVINVSFSRFTTCGRGWGCRPASRVPQKWVPGMSIFFFFSIWLYFGWVYEMSIFFDLYIYKCILDECTLDANSHQRSLCNASLLITLLEVAGLRFVGQLLVWCATNFVVV